MQHVFEIGFSIFIEGETSRNRQNCLDYPEIGKRIQEKWKEIRDLFTDSNLTRDRGEITQVGERETPMLSLNLGIKIALFFHDCTDKSTISRLNMCVFHNSTQNSSTKRCSPFTDGCPMRARACGSLGQH